MKWWSIGDGNDKKDDDNDNGNGRRSRLQYKLIDTNLTRLGRSIVDNNDNNEEGSTTVFKKMLMKSMRRSRIQKFLLERI
ncbi:hypothetical protein DERP_002489 [Dermatophagoides pteronyssinus]|uniref:Uncharacterized protein n=1 Tax=Dermatophagoides pteronyssinus TaxID=6956 RepID=A0ABQ8JID3_DERPT|nr:hypothetical protein DERP_002489 [Dermatophagoides pteronyssinus]